MADASVDDGSFDPDGDNITLEQTPLGPYDLGNTEVTLTVTDNNGASGTCNATVTVVDEEAPVIYSVTGDPNKLWPPNHKMVPVVLAVDVFDNCDSVCQIISVESNEPVRELGIDNTDPDWIIRGDLAVELRAERSGTGSGRVYTITVGCTDQSWNSSIDTIKVTVPHDKGKKKNLQNKKKK
jgi:PKD repeat protein